MANGPNTKELEALIDLRNRIGHPTNMEEGWKAAHADFTTKTGTVVHEEGTPRSRGSGQKTIAARTFRRWFENLPPSVVPTDWISLDEARDLFEDTIDLFERGKAGRVEASSREGDFTRNDWTYLLVHGPGVSWFGGGTVNWRRNEIRTPHFHRTGVMIKIVEAPAPPAAPTTPHPKNTRR